MKKCFLLLLTSCLMGGTARAVADSTATRLAIFEGAKAQLQAMLDGREPLSYERAVFVTENAFYGNHINPTVFNAALDWHTQNIRSIADAHRNVTSRPDTGYGLGAAQRALMPEALKRKELNEARLNYAIYTYMIKPNMFVIDSFVVASGGFTYAKDDPFATSKFENSQTVHLLEYGRGNCYALATLFKIFSDRLHSGAQLCTAPGHIYIRHADDKGRFYNVELSKKAFPGTGTISAWTYTTPQALRSGISQRELDDRQAVALCLVYLAKGCEQRLGHDAESFKLACAETALHYDSLNLNALLLKADVLEARLLSRSQTVASIKGSADFTAYQQLIARLYTLGYREMPLEMKNLLVKGWSKDSTARLPLKNHTPVGFQTDKPDTRYASLSWGVLDEFQLPKAKEQYGRTVFDTRSQKITGFATQKGLYNGYEFDPVMFAWNVDPLAHKFPWQSPYAAMDNSPIWKNDPTGASGEVAINKEAKTITISSRIIIYGTMANVQTARDMAAKTQHMWNAANGKVEIGGETYSVKFKVEGQYRDVRNEIRGMPGVPAVAAEVLFNNDIKNNFYRVEQTDNASETALPDQSFFFGSNSGYISSEQNAKNGGTTIGHEYGHSLGLGHVKYNGKMRAMNTESQLGPEIKDRVATQEDIDDLELGKLHFNSSGKADLGEKTNVYYNQSLQEARMRDK